tara:strand:- start:6588 stop:7859 length:1272 start_codon:yes stop_codon:yes gene_type:complete
MVFSFYIVKEKIMNFTRKPIVLALVASGFSSIGAMSIAHADDAFVDALTGGKVSFSARARYEAVTEDNSKKDADAYTLRTTLGYKTGSFKGFGAFVEFEDVRAMGDEKFNNTENGHTRYSVVADPVGTEVNQGYLSYNGFDTEFKLGRQEITYRGAPFHRYIGNVLWRQNHQSFDGFSFVNKSLADTTIGYAHIENVNTIFGENSVAKPNNIDMSTDLFNVQYSGSPIGDLEAYAYLIENEDVITASTETFGLRLSGAQAVNDDLKILYTAEYASQGDYKDGVMDDQNYYLAELGGKYKGWVAKFSYEMQEGDGTYSFNTPLGTNHAFQGWADIFLSTPKNGLEDMYFTVVGKVLGAKVVAVYHDFETDKDGIDAGNEFDILAEKTFNKHYTLGVKYSDYNAGDASLAYVDTEKFWLYGQIKF